MRFDDDTYYDSEDDNDLWDDELDISAGEDRQAPPDTSHHPYAPHTSYSPYDTDDDYRSGSVSDAYAGSPEPKEEERPTQAAEEPEDYYSDPEPEPKESRKSRRGGFFSSNGEEDDGNDYYDSSREPAPRPKTPKPPKLDPEDPDYWIDGAEESPLSGLMPPPGKKWIWKLVAAVAAVLTLVGGWIWFFRPYSDSAVKYGYIKNMERRGYLIKTFEGTMIPYKELGDPDPFYFQELKFSVASDSVAAKMKRMMLGCIPVRVEYEAYNAPLPWKGEQTMVVIKADTADPRKILPPEYRFNDK